MFKTRDLLRRHDNFFFRHPTDADLNEWTSDAPSAHQWVDFDAAASAAYIWNTLKGEEVTVSTLTLML
jgi:hypothetical protein